MTGDYAEIKKDEELNLMYVRNRIISVENDK